MVMEDARIDELILQVFEEHEDLFFWPVSSQKEAKNFVKHLHDKGAPYEEICKEIGEFEHNFSAWRKGLGRVGIGTRMIERINRTVEEVIESDDEDEAEHNLKLLAKVNQKNQNKINNKTQQNKPEEKDTKQQKKDITSSMMKNIDKASAKMEDTKMEIAKREASKADRYKQEEKQEAVVVPSHKEESKPSKAQVEKTSTEALVKPVKSSNEAPVKPVKSSAEAPVKPVKVAETSTKPKTEVKKETPRVEVPKTTQQVVTKQTEVTTEKAPEEEEKKEDPEVDEVKKKMEAIRKKVEMMKKAKAEQAADISERRSAERSAVSAPLVTAEEDSSTSGNESTSSSDLEDDSCHDDRCYDSDLDPDNYDSDLEYELNKEVKRVAQTIAATREKARSADGPGHLYLYSDSPSNDKEHRVKIGVTRCPEKRFNEARKYNIALKQVSTVPVSKRNAALKLAHKSLSNMRLDYQTDWFKGPIDTILQKVSSATEQYGTGPSLLTFQC